MNLLLPLYYVRVADNVTTHKTYVWRMQSQWRQTWYLNCHGEKVLRISVDLKIDEVEKFDRRSLSGSSTILYSSRSTLVLNSYLQL